MLKRLCWFSLALAIIALAAGREAHARAASRVTVASVDGPIVAVVADYLDRAIKVAEQDGSSALVLELNTPGGDVNTTLRIIQRFGASRVPIIVYVAPRRGEAFSAGTLITLGGHLAAMSPETKIGAAKPISGSGENLDSDSRDKAVSALRATVRTLTRNRGAQAIDWAEKTITEAVAATEEEALKLGAIDLIATDLNDLLAKVDGRTVAVNGAEVVLHTKLAEIRPVDLTLGESLLLILVSPNVAAILLFIAINGLLIEWQAPGVGVGGIIGAIAFILFLYAAGTLPVNLTGLVFVGLAAVLFIFDLTSTQHGVLTAGGIASFVIGALILFEPSYIPVSFGLVAGMGLTMGGLFAFGFRKAYQARRLKPATGTQSLIGRVALARTDLTPDGHVFVEGERWEAISESGPVSAGEKIVITAVDGLRLRVKKIQRIEITD
ncbi:MAG: nodulation protein NfeD [Chloroflexi bacterium]|nr:nodulation protein NfeD [Chloroflexota bacterium]